MVHLICSDQIEWFIQHGRNWIFLFLFFSEKNWCRLCLLGYPTVALKVQEFCKYAFLEILINQTPVTHMALLSLHTTQPVPDFTVSADSIFVPCPLVGHCGPGSHDRVLLRWSPFSSPVPGQACVREPWGCWRSPTAYLASWTFLTHLQTDQHQNHFPTVLLHWVT